MAPTSQSAPARPNAGLRDIDLMSTADLVAEFAAGERAALAAVEQAAPALARAVDAISNRFSAGGRLVLLGAGTPGRLCVLDAAECGPTFSTSPERVIGILAGGPAAMTEAIEDAEDDEDAGRADVAAAELTPQDTVVCVSASGRTPYTVAAATAAVATGALTVGITAVPGSLLGHRVQLPIEIPTGPEIITGSTRLKAATMQKVVLSLISTLVMIRAGRTFGNLMSGVQVSNLKLAARARTIVATAAGVPEQRAAAALADCGDEIGVAVVALRGELPAERARALLARHGGRIRDALGDLPDGPE
jgi:N-acetylmuramic acid 6-phosphate etherase